MTQDKQSDWIPEIEIADAKVKWAFSHFDGREDTFNAEGDHNFTLIIPEDDARDLMEKGWPIREMPGYEEGDPPEYLLKVKISYKFEDPRIYLIKGNRKFLCQRADLRDIARNTCERLDVILTPSRWNFNGKSGVSAYVKEMYATVSQSRFSEMYQDMETI